MKIRRIEANNFGVFSGRLGQQVLIGTEYVGDLHIRMVGVASWTDDVPFEINGVFVVSGDGENSDFVAVLDIEGFEFLRDVRLIRSVADIEGQHGALFVSDETLHFDVAQSGGGQHAAG